MTVPLVPDVLPDTSPSATLDDVIAGTDQVPVVPVPAPVEDTPAADTEPLSTEDVPAADQDAPSDDSAAASTDDVPLEEVEIPHFNPELPPIKLAGVPKEAADAFRRVAKSAARADQLQQRVEQLSDSNAEDRATLNLLKESPLESMFLLHQNHPDAGKTFASEWLQMNATQVLPLLKELQILQPDEDGVLQFVDPRTAKLMGENATFRAERAVEKGKQGYETQATRERSIQRIQDATDQVVATLNIPPGKRRDLFVRMCEDDLVPLARTNPNTSVEQMIVHLQELATQFQAIAAPAAKGKTLTVQQPRDQAGRFAEQQKQAAISKKLGGGVSAMPAMAGFATPDDNATLDDIISPRR